MGTGYSYCNSDAAFATNNSQIGADLVTLFAAFLEDLPVFEVSSIYIHVHMELHTLCDYPLFCRLFHFMSSPNPMEVIWQLHLV